MKQKLPGVLLTAWVLTASLGSLQLAAADSGVQHDSMAGMPAMPGMHEDDTAALGEAGKASEVKRTIEVTMNDTMRFEPAALSVKQGETVKLIAKNVGKVKHELVLGTDAELKEHAELMRKFPGMEHSDPNMVTVEPGKTGEVIWRFTRAGTFTFACLQPGHFEAGMLGKVTVQR